MTMLVRADTILEGFGAGADPVLHHDAGLLIEAGKVAAIGPWAALRAVYPDSAVAGGPGMVLIPGLVNAHHHVGTTPLQLGSPDHPLELWFASRMGFRDLEFRLDTLFSAFEMLASGVTTVQHLHSRIPGSVDDVLGVARTVVGAYREIGMRASYSVALRDQNRLVYQDDGEFTASLPAPLRPGMEAYFQRFTMPLDEQIAVFKALRAELADDPLVKLQLGPANLHWLSDRALEETAALSAKYAMPMHMHLVETAYQHEYARRRTGGTALAHIHRLGLTGPLLTIGHGVWLSQADIETCAHTGTRVCHNCSSNFRLKSGIAPVNRLMAAGVRIALGMDEAGINDDRDMLSEMRLVLRAHREPGIEARAPSPAQVLRMATEGGAATTPFGTTIGHLRPGAWADLVLFDWHAVTHPWQNPVIPIVDVLVQRAKAAAVKTVMVAGEVVYADGRFAKVDRERVLEALAAWFRRPLSQVEEERWALGLAAFPHVKAFYDGYLQEPLPRGGPFQE